MKERVRAFLTLIFVGMIVLFVTERSRVAASPSLPAPMPAPVISAPRDAGTITFLPFISVAPTPRDFRITGIEITQSVQDASNGVPLVADRPTVVRVYAQDVYGNGGLVNVSLTGTNENGLNETMQSGLVALSASPSRGDLGSSVNFVLPSSWTGRGTYLTLAATVDASHLVAETDELNNYSYLTRGFNYVPPLNLVIVPIAYTHTGPGGGFYSAPTLDTVSDWVMRSYPASPVNVTMHSPMPFNGNLSTNPTSNPADDQWMRLLQEVAALKVYDSAPDSTVYYALIPLTYSWWNGDVPAMGGLSYIANSYNPSRVGTGLNYPWSADTTSKLAVHEIGHTFRLGHVYVSGCPVPDPLTQDATYPYASGSIGEYGLDLTSSMTVYNPSSAKDFMTYCAGIYPQWWSDYYYKQLYSTQSNYGGAPPVRAPVAQNSLFIRASISAQGAVSIYPLYAMTSVVSEIPGSGDYTVQLIDASGQVIASYLAAVIETSEGTGRGIQLRVPSPSTPVALVRILRGTTRVAERVISTTRAPIASPSVESLGTDFIVRWNAGNAPSIVRYVPDSGSLVTLGVDVTSGELRVDSRTLPGGNGHFEVIAGDGGVSSSSRAPSRSISIPNSTPTAWITGAITIKAGNPLVLTGHGMNREQGVLPDLRWTLDGTQVVTGATLQMSKLNVGIHTVTLTVRDARGNTAQATQTITVTP
jgi:hypothetical protein